VRDVIRVFWIVVAVVVFVLFLVPDQFDSMLQTDVVGTSTFMFRGALAVLFVFSMVMLNKFGIEWMYARMGYMLALFAMFAVSMMQIMDGDYANWVWVVPAMFLLVLVLEWQNWVNLLMPADMES